MALISRAWQYVRIQDGKSLAYPPFSFTSLLSGGEKQAGVDKGWDDWPDENKDEKSQSCPGALVKPRQLVTKVEMDQNQGKRGPKH